MGVHDYKLSNYHGQLNVSELRRLADRVRDGSGYVVGGDAGTFIGDGGAQIVPEFPVKFLAAIYDKSYVLGTSGLPVNFYAFAEVSGSVTGTFAPPTSGLRTDEGMTVPAIEVNGDATVPTDGSMIVELTLAPTGDYYTFTKAGGAAASGRVNESVFTALAGQSIPNNNPTDFSHWLANTQGDWSCDGTNFSCSNPANTYLAVVSMNWAVNAAGSRFGVLAISTASDTTRYLTATGFRAPDVGLPAPPNFGSVPTHPMNFSFLLKGSQAESLRVRLFQNSGGALNAGLIDAYGGQSQVLFYGVDF